MVSELLSAIFLVSLVRTWALLTRFHEFTSRHCERSVKLEIVATRLATELSKRGALFRKCWRTTVESVQRVFDAIGNDNSASTCLITLVDNTAAVSSNLGTVIALGGKIRHFPSTNETNDFPSTVDRRYTTVP